MLTKKVTTFIESNSLIFPNEHIIIALSGGRDSISLLHQLNSLREKLNISISAVHINHGVRGIESDKDEEFVKSYCVDLGIECSIYKLSCFTKDTGENTLRKARYAKFEKELKKYKNSKLATAHHQDDQLETYLMRLFKGSGPKGLRGIPAQRGKFIRPLLSCTRTEITIFCKNNNIRFREDSSNQATDKLRNKIRHNLSPVLKEVFGDEYLSLFAKSHNSTQRFYEEYFESNQNGFEKYLNNNRTRICIKKSDFISFPKFQKLHFLEYCFSSVYDLHFLIQENQFKEFESFVMSARTGSVFLFSEKSKVLIDRKQLVLYSAQKKESKIWELYEDQSVKIGHSLVSLTQVKKQSINLTNDPAIEFISGDSIKLPLQVRNWKKGDFFSPLGNKGKQKISDFFINKKINLAEKYKIPLVICGKEIIWVAGYRISESTKITEKTKTIYKLEIKKL